MLKTIKRTKQMRLDELVKYAFKNKVKNKKYRSKTGKSVLFLDNGRFETLGNDIGDEDLFPVEIGEQITEDTEFKDIVAIAEDKFGITTVGYNTDSTTSVKKTIENYKNANHKPLRLYAIIDEKLELIWENE